MSSTDVTLISAGPPHARSSEFLADLESLPLDALLVGQDGSVLAANPRWLEVVRSCGQADLIGDFVGSPLSVAMLGSDPQADDAQWILEGILAVASGASQSFVGEYRMRGLASGTTALMVIASSVEQSGRRRALVTRLDVADAQALQHRCELLHVALQRASEFVFFVDSSGKVTFANGRLRRALDYPKVDWDEMSLWEICPDFDAEQWRVCVEELRELGTLSIKGSLSTNEGVLFPAELVASYFDLGGETVFFYGKEPGSGETNSGSFSFRQRLREKTSRLEASNSRLQDEMARSLEAEKKLRDSQERLELAIWATGLGLWDWRIKRDQLSLDQRALGLLDLDQDCALFTMDQLRARIHRDDLVGFDNRLERHLRGETEGLDSVHRMIDIDGNYGWYQVQGRASDRNSKGLARRMIGTVQDVSERKALEGELLQSQKMEAIGRLAGGVAHDFNNLLTAINGYSDLVLRQLEPQSPHFSRIEEVSKAGQRAAVLTNRLLSFGRKQIQQPEPLELSQTIKSLKPLLVPALGGGIELLLDLNEVPLVRADLHQVEQAILNLVVNGRDAMPNGGQLSISVGVVSVSPRGGGPSRPHVRISVSDQGSGIDESIREHIFEPFFTTKATGDGSGLGLPMVYGVVQQSDGLIEIESAPDKGTTFHLYFPTIEESLDSSVVRLRNESEADGEAAGSLLLVEDEPAVKNLVQEALSHKGYSVVAVSTAEEALDAVAARAEPFDLLVTDVVLGGTNGVELARILRENRARLPVLFVSGYAEDAVDEDLSLGPLTAFLRKPFRTEKLYEQVAQLLHPNTLRKA